MLRVGGGFWKAGLQLYRNSLKTRLPYHDRFDTYLILTFQGKLVFVKYIASINIWLGSLLLNCIMSFYERSSNWHEQGELCEKERTYNNWCYIFFSFKFIFTQIFPWNLHAFDIGVLLQMYYKPYSALNKTKRSLKRKLRPFQNVILYQKYCHKLHILFLF